MSLRPLYFDHAASTPLDPRVRKAMESLGDVVGNPSSLHSYGQTSARFVNDARAVVARALGLSPENDLRSVLFTGSATEANNLALRGAVRKFRRTYPGLRPRLVVSAVEHESVLETARDLARDGAELVIVPVDREGRVDVRKLARALNERTALVSVMYANNETGTIQPIAAITARVAAFRARENGKPARAIDCVYPLVHTDAAQAFQFLPSSPRELGIDLMTLSGHKIYGPKGIGVLYRAVLGRGHEYLLPVLTGGGQEFGLRSGTESAPLVVGIAEAVRLAQEKRSVRTRHVRALRERFVRGVRRGRIRAHANGPLHPDEVLPSIVSMTFPGCRADALLTACDLSGLAASAGSACAARTATPSHVLAAIGLSRAAARATLRFSFGAGTTPADIDRGLAVIKKLVS